MENKGLMKQKSYMITTRDKRENIEILAWKLADQEEEDG